MKMIRLLSEGDVYYEHDPSSSPIRVDAWGKYYLGNCYSKKDSSLLKKVTICSPSNSISREFVSAMWKLLKEKHINFKQTAIIPIIDYVVEKPQWVEECTGPSIYLNRRVRPFWIEDYYEGVSLYDLMHGQVCGVDGQTIEFAVNMYEMYQNNRIDFVKIVAKEVLMMIKIMHDYEIGVSHIEPPENIIFTESGEIKIRMINSLRGYPVYCCLPLGWPEATFTNEYLYPEIREIKGYAGERSDVYSVGIFLYSIATGHLPCKERISIEECHRVHSRGYIFILDDDYDNAPRYILPHYEDKLLLHEIKDQNFRKILEKATRFNPNERYESAIDFINALEGNVDYVDNTEYVDNRNIKETIPWYKKIASFPLSLFRIKIVK